jgi:hypothetical protein
MTAITEFDIDTLPELFDSTELTRLPCGDFVDSDEMLSLHAAECTTCQREGL